MELSASESGGTSKRAAIGLAFVALAIVIGVLVWWFSQQKSATSSAPPAVVTRATVKPATTQPATTQPATTPLTSCVVSGIDACVERVFIRSTTEDGLNYPRLHNDVTTGQVVRAIESVPIDGETTHWRLIKTSTNNFMIVSQRNSQEMRVPIVNGIPGMISCDPALAFDLSKKGADGVCAEFAIAYNAAAAAFTISIPAGYPAAGTKLALSGNKLDWGAEWVLFRAGPPTLWKFERVV